MASRLKEDEKNERIIRGLLKLTENRRCINCNSLGPQYVCTNFWTFVCTTCSGIHREFTHRVKSVSMAKFSSQEVSALQEGGNRRAKDIYFKEWDSQRNSVPDSINVDRLRELIKHVYVDRRYSGEKNYEKPPRGKMGDDNSRGSSRSPPYGDRYEQRYNERSSPGGRNDDRNSRYSYDDRRSPGYDQESRQYGDNKKSPVRKEVINDWCREDRFRNGRRAEDNRISNGDSKLDRRSPEWPKDTDTSSPPMVRPVRDILGDNVIPLRIGEPPKANNRRIVDGTHTQTSAFSSSPGSANGNSVEVKWESSGSLIDFDSDPEPPHGATVSHAQQTTMAQPDALRASNLDNNWASFDFVSEAKVSPPNVNAFESALSELVPASQPDHMTGTHDIADIIGNPTSLSVSGKSTAVSVGYTPIFLSTTSSSAAVPASSFSAIPPNGVAANGLTSMLDVSGGNSAVVVTDADSWSNMQHQQPSLFPAASSQSAYRQYTTIPGTSSIKPWNLSLASNALEHLGSSSLQAPEPVSKTAHEVTSGVLSQPSIADVKSSGRTEQPQDFFTINSSSIPIPVQGWQSGPPHVMGFAMPGAHMPTYPHLSKSANPFDIGDEPSPVQAPTFPSMRSLRGALPNIPPSSNLQHTSSFLTPSPTWMQPGSSSPYTSEMPPQAPSYASAILPRSYIAPVPSNMPLSRHQSLGSFVNEGVPFNSFNHDQQPAGRYSAPSTPNHFPSIGGNPFG